ETLAPPVRPLPTVRGSGPPINLGTMMPKGMPPRKYPAASAKRTRIRSSVCIAGKYKARSEASNRLPRIRCQLFQQAARVMPEVRATLWIGGDFVDEVGQAHVHRSGDARLDAGACDRAVHPRSLCGLGRWRVSGCPDMQPE